MLVRHFVAGGPGIKPSCGAFTFSLDQRSMQTISIYTLNINNQKVKNLINTIKKCVLVVVGTIATLLGLLWFLQGADLVRIQPIMCVADCEPITGGSLLWAVVGLIVLVIGIVTIYSSLRHSKKDKTN